MTIHFNKYWPISHALCMKAFQWNVTMMLSSGWVGGSGAGGGQGGRKESSRGELRSAGRSCRLCWSSFLNSLVSKKVSAQQIADEITRLLSPFPSSCQTPVGHFCSPAKGQTWKRANLQTWSGNLCYGERILTFESYTWAGLGSIAGTACSCI